MTAEEHSIEDLGNNCTREYRHDGRMVLYTVRGQGRAVTDSWINAAMADLEAAYAEERTVLVLHDLRQSGTSTYGIRRTKEIFDNPLKIRR